jgi:hypothetical protein
MNLKRMRYHIIFLKIAVLLPCIVYAQVSVHIAENCKVNAAQSDLIISGDWYNAGTMVTTDSRLIFNGNENQYLQDSGRNIISQLLIQKLGGSLYLADSIRIADSLSLVTGKIVSADTSLLILLSPAGINGGDSGSFVDGPMAKVYAVNTLPDSFRFPTGKEFDFRPVTVNLSQVTGDSLFITIEQINNPANTLSANYNNLDRVSRVRYWHIVQAGPGTFSAAYVTLSYDTVTTDDGVEQAAELKIAHLDTTGIWTWNDAGGIGSANNTGIIRSNSLTGLGSGYFTFGDAAGGADISLPVVLSLLELSEQRGEVYIKWQSESEVNNNSWLVQRKEETDTTAVFETIASIDGQGNKSTRTEYTVMDKNTVPGQAYAYRLADVSYNGRIHYHDPVSILIDLPGKYQLFQNYPNPFNARTNIMYDLPQDSDVQAEIYSVTGQKVAILVNAKQPGGYYKIIWDGKNLHGNSIASGMYVLTFRANAIKAGSKESYNQVKKIILVK